MLTGCTAPATPPVLIEQAPEFRRGGYMIDFWGGVGYRVARRMGIEAAIRDAGYDIGSVRSVDDTGKIKPMSVSMSSGR